MREAAFVKQNKDKWIQFERVLSNNIHVDPNELSDLYIEVTDHLSYAKTFYSKSNTERYLNQLASQAHQKIYKTKKESKNRVITFFKTEFPLMFYKHHRELLISFLVFTMFIVIGAFSAANEGDFVRSFLGDGYVNMTLSNIEKGDPMAVYKQQGEFNMFLGITINNIRVALMAFAYGLLLGIGSLYIMLQNGIMLGSFQYFFYDQGLLWESARTIWIHGTIEISVIIVAGCAGLVLGNGMLFTGTYTRLESFKRGVKNGLKILMSTIPFFIIAGFLEGFVTRHTEMPDWLALLIITASLGVILFYYVIYPIKLHKQQLNHKLAIKLTNKDEKIY
ncbi:stage II sporulation protein M [Oceanihabitans sediminis]|uniref:Stage II sporulation protein M n=1 Tax=Oceanihabitans sediminis TaxID=1812012 RepID=A0A368P3A0_9FLAO|nr:stage II sporulation protein M [Oceanihabitans sediminis]MDX1277413.1 stage II sporulation protein M [Oceanihabitans sediminis]MDX1774210.1 stage II sporulation protein M [Oceanihabitans sediminis]RBP30780.1 putative membrane protein SpoIIM required for sporulation [Oceanihabitans sediminis]RCU56750.1 stage II sporulation protein M [Oceanihabitans sediminis]